MKRKQRKQKEFKIEQLGTSFVAGILFFVWREGHTLFFVFERAGNVVCSSVV